MQPFAAENTRAVGPDERRDDEVTGFQRPHLVAHILDDADELVPHAAAGLRGLHLSVRPESLPQIAARVTATRASVGSTSWASGTSSTRTSPAPYMTVARIDGAAREGLVGHADRDVVLRHGRSLPRCIRRRHRVEGGIALRVVLFVVEEDDRE